MQRQRERREKRRKEMKEEKSTEVCNFWEGKEAVNDCVQCKDVEGVRRRERGKNNEM